MTKHWKHPVICSHITAKLVLLKIRCDAKYLTALPLNQPEIIENVEVTLLDANHCPGSVMFLFKVINNITEGILIGVLEEFQRHLVYLVGIFQELTPMTIFWIIIVCDVFLQGKHINTKRILVGVLEKFKSYLVFPYGILQELI